MSDDSPQSGSENVAPPKTEQVSGDANRSKGQQRPRGQQRPPRRPRSHPPGNRPSGQRESPPRERQHQRRPEPDPIAPASTAPPPAMPRPEIPRELRRDLTIDGREWTCWVSGIAAYGTGHSGLGMVQTLHFADAAEPQQPLREVLLSAGRFSTLFDSELVDLFRQSREIVIPEEGFAPRRFKKRGEGLS